MSASDSLFENLDKLDEYLHGLTLQKVKSDNLTYKEALKQVHSEVPALVALREALYLRRGRAVFQAKTFEWVNGKLKEAADQIDSLVKRAMQEHPELSYGRALLLVAGEHPDLIGRYDAAHRLLEG
jgi:hypothetical protein